MMLAHQFNYLRVRIVSVLLVLLIPFFILSLLAIDQQRIAALERAQADAAELTRAIAFENKSHIESTRLLMTAFARLPTVQSRKLDSCSPFFAEIIEQYPFFNGIYAVNTDTNLGFCASQQPSRQTDNSPFEWYQRLLSTQSFVMSNYRIGATTGKPGVTLAMPVFDEQGELIAAVGIGLSLNWFSEVLQNLIFPQESLVLILDGQGNVLTSNQAPERFVLGQPYDETEVREAVLKSETGTLETINANGIPYFYTYTSLGQDEGNLRLVIGFSQSVLFASVKDIQAKTIAAFAGLSILVVGIAWVSGGILTQPITQLTATIYQVVEGKVGALSDVKPQIVELNALLRAYDGLMTWVNAKNQRQLDDLEMVNGQLRREITERTKAQEQIQFLQQLSASLSEALTTEQIAHSVLEYSTNYIGATSSAFDLLPEQAKMFSRIAIYPDTIENDQATTRPIISDFLTWQAMSDHKPLWLTPQQAMVDRFPMLNSDSLKGYMLLPVILHGRTIGVISYLFANPVDKNDDRLQLLHTMAYQCAQVFERVRLSDEAKESVRLQERHRFAGDLHDSISQTLYAATITAEALPTQWTRNQTQGILLLNQLVMLNRAVMGEMRTLLLELHPEAIAKTELDTLFNQLINRAKGRSQMEAKLEIIGSVIVLPPDVHETLYRIGQESINNILKHSQASQFWLTLTYLEDNVSLSIRDNGQGFDEQSHTIGFGLHNIRERAKAIRADLVVQSSLGQGVEVILTWQLASNSNQQIAI